MRKLRFLLPWTVVLLVACVLVACGISHGPSVRLQSVTISPATASSQGQFTATGFYSDGSKVTPLPALWFPIQPWYVPPMNPVRQMEVDETGSAVCGAVPGTFAVVATAPVDPHLPLSKMDPNTPQVSGAAQLTCP